MTAEFRTINRGYNTTFQPNRLSVGLVVPIETYDRGPVPTMAQHLERVQLAEKLGFSAVWLRDIPFDVPTFGDTGQGFDPFVYLGYLAGGTRTIGLGVASIILPLRHPAHVAKSAASADVLSDGRLMLGIASGDRPEEYPALNIPFHSRGDYFRESYDYIRAMSGTHQTISNRFGDVSSDLNMLPKPSGGRLPLLITGSSQQSQDWICTHGDGWMTYPRPAPQQAHIIQSMRARGRRSGEFDRPVMEPLYVDLTEDPDASPRPIHLGLRLGANPLCDYLLSRQQIGVNHVAINLRFNQLDIEATLEQLAERVLPQFNH